MVTVDDAEWAARLRRLREHGMNVSAADRHASAQPVLEAYLETGYNYRMTDIQAAVGLVQLGRLAGLVAQRRALAARYHELLADIDGLVPVRDPAYGADQLPVVLGAARPELRRSAATRCWPSWPPRGVSARRGIMAAHLEPAYAGRHARRRCR